MTYMSSSTFVTIHIFNLVEPIVIKVPNRLPFCEVIRGFSL